MITTLIGGGDNFIVIAQNPYALYFITSSNDQRAVDKETIYQSGGQMAVWQNAGMSTNLSMSTAGPCSTQDLVDSYEMANGEAPITGYSDATRLVPIVNSASGYDPMNPYVGCDPIEAELPQNPEKSYGGKCLSYERESSKAATNH